MLPWLQANWTHFLVYTVSSLVEQTTPFAHEIFDESASATCHSQVSKGH